MVPMKFILSDLGKQLARGRIAPRFRAGVEALINDAASARDAPAQ
jgi:hypothetical protein